MAHEPLDLDAVIAANYDPQRWFCWWDRGSIGVKLGRLSIFTYRWQRSARLSWTYLCGREHIVLGPRN